VAAALSAPSDVSATAMSTSELGRVLVTWTSPDCTETSGLIDAFIIEYCTVANTEPCISYGRLSSVCASLRLSVCHTLALCQNDAS